jgi:hypothetical protein
MRHKKSDPNKTHTIARGRIVACRASVGVTSPWFFMLDPLRDSTHAAHINVVQHDISAGHPFQPTDTGCQPGTLICPIGPYSPIVAVRLRNVAAPSHKKGNEDDSCDYQF